MDDSLVAIEGPEGSLTYGDLHAGAERAARRLAALGVTRGDRVALDLPPGRAFVEVFWGAPLIGAVVAPVNTRLTEAERSDLLGDALRVARPLDGPEADVALRDPDPGAPHTLLFTSGSTARPKPVELTWANHVASAEAAASRVPLGPGDRWLCVLPLFHVGGLAILVRCRLAGATVVLRERFDAAEAGEALATCTHASLVPAMLRRMDVGETPALQAVLLGGGPVPADLLDSPLPLMPTYGMTETASQIVTALPGERAGRPLPGVEIRIGEGDEIFVRGPMVAPGAIADDGWLHTGDTGRMDGEGRLHVEGRIKDVVISGGENVSAAEVEEVLMAHPDVSDVCVKGEPDEEWGEAVVAHVVLSAPASDGDLRAHCRERLAGYKLPRGFHRHVRLPRNAMGKLIRASVGPPQATELASGSVALFNAAASGGDPGPALALLHPEVDYRPVTVAAEGRWLRGREEVEAYLRGLAEAFSELEVTTDEVAEFPGEIILMSGRWRAVGRASGLQLDTAWASVTEYRDGLFTWLRAFGSRAEAIEAAERRLRGESDPE